MLFAPALVALLALPQPCTDELRFGVVVLGEDAKAVAALQQEIDQSFVGASGTCAHGIEDLYETLAPEEIAPADRSYQSIAQKAATILEEAKEAYYRNNLAQSLDRFGSLRSLFDRAGYVPAAKRTQLYLWRTAVYLAMKDDAQAAREVKEALTVEPDLKVDLKEFRPSVAEIADEVRGSGLSMHKVVLAGLPEGAEVRVDDRSVESSFEVPSGRHWVVITAPKRENFSRRLIVKKNRKLRVPLAYAVDADLSQALRQMAQGAEGTVPSRLRTSLEPLKLTGVLVVHIAKKQDPVAVFAALGPDPIVERPHTLPRTVDGAQGFATWAKARVDAAAAERAAREAPVVEDVPPLAFSIWAGSLTAFRQRGERSSDGREFTLPFVGTGPRASADLSYYGATATLDTGWVTYDITEVTTPLPDGVNKTTVRGGSSFFTRAGVGYRYTLAKRRGKLSPWISGLIVGAFESHTARDLSDGTGDLGVIASYNRTSAGLSLDGGVPFRVGGGSLALSAGVSFAPFHNWTETPNGTSGSVGEVAPELAARFSAVYALSRKAPWAIRADLEASSQSVRFDGDAAAPFIPAFNNVELTQNVFGGSLSVVWGI